MRHKVTFIPGDGIGPEVAQAAKKCVEATGIDIEWEELEAGEASIGKYGTPLPEPTIASIRKNKVALKGPITTPIGGGFRSVNVELRKKLDLFACVRPCKSYPGANSRYENINLVIVRENSEDLYAGIEFEKDSSQTKKLIQDLTKLSQKQIKEDSAISIKPISKSASERIIRFAFDYAVKNNRKKISCIHKANIMKFTDGLFLQTARDIAQNYSGKVEFEDRLVDSLCMQLVQKPNDYDVLVLPNLYGDIISDLCAGLIGGLGLAPGANIGDGLAIFEPTHGSAPKYKGLNKVNPAATILSAVLMLHYLGEEKAAQALEHAVAEVIREGKLVTYDLKKDRNDPSKVGTSEMTQAIIDKLK